MDVAPLDILTRKPCEKCGDTRWIVDTADGLPPFWLLCMGIDCTNTQPIPDDIDVVND